ncbi:MAG: glycerol-3-phosphate 1-O-acyltransferase PlsY [Candidatus Omnitrophota bacterium]|nr:glycerol-3-phosphate 1-O-acyltransferase PlsY [Candidatus Omnitrophota bacterium]MBU1928963.1 glycerol-3-phosphate 1-O-acyltransferase PlsY [Candidatus Omnitrophota bacterium]MBU2035720.1 glycerol-3-phosphate 1-O-acyltransferase PlsY [Candidatus Omnitrophota bacterium]
MLWIIPALLVSYLIGSIPTAYIFAKVLKGIDIRKTGSGNVGATNAARILGKKTAIVILSLDILKGLLPVIFLGDLISPQVGLNQEVLRIMLGFSSIAGHNWTIFLGFRGGKGIATTLGVLLGLTVRLAGLKIVLIWVIITWVIAFIPFRIVSLASVISGLSLPVYSVLFKQSKIIFISSIVITVFIILRHKSNLQRLFQGKENRLF